MKEYARGFEKTYELIWKTIGEAEYLNDIGKVLDPHNLYGPVVPPGPPSPNSAPPPPLPVGYL